jgi:hypothetical protein
MASIVLLELRTGWAKKRPPGAGPGGRRWNGFLFGSLVD